jgi:hypothetical protein
MYPLSRRAVCIVLVLVLLVIRRRPPLSIKASVHAEAGPVTSHRTRRDVVLEVAPTNQI